MIIDFGVFFNLGLEGILHTQFTNTTRINKVKDYYVEIKAQFFGLFTRLL